MIQPLAIERINRGDSHFYMNDVAIVPSLTEIIGRTLGKPKGIPDWYLDAGSLLHLYIYRRLMGAELEEPPKDDQAAQDAWAGYLEWEQWRLRMLKAGTPPVFFPLWMERPVGAHDYWQDRPYACTIDSIGMLGPGRVVIIEWKRSISPKLERRYQLQLTGQMLAAKANAPELFPFGDPELFLCGRIDKSGAWGLHEIQPDVPGFLKLLEDYYS